ncbi:BZ3500_MvSof-1268-A1-R1_Chr8-1g10037 [Microbotryum saponariae]|uniref:BZ3500_MvSof-1268-A1-R1_Chr8-1g10037 protein n=1 Tax=Microbotryum saponariae TaxID=289078 RepID=A0A2X0M826_9BASI|nr:BZ3500_MvSof-1268-A1-R1_Chr8-1g10037 [Microbotryum saponariae]SDA08323.1 BZ3501_MvSof-1269-A2-R1_Chr8-1g09760 [Microbotryum saponariae]
MPVPQTPSSDSDSDEPNWGDSSHSSADDSDSYSESESEFEDVAIDHRRAIRLWTAIHGSHRNATGRMSQRKWTSLKHWAARRYYSELKMAAKLGISHARLVQAVKKFNSLASKGNAWSRFLSDPVVKVLHQRASKESDHSKSQSITKLAAQLWNFLRDQGDLGSAQLGEDDEELVRAAFAAAEAGNNTTFTSIVPPTIITRSPSDIPSPTRMEQCKKYIAELRDLAQRMSKLYGVETLAFIVPRYQDDVSPATKATVHSIGGLRFAAHCNDFKDPSGNSLLSNFASKMSWDETLKANEATDLKEANTRSINSATRGVLGNWHGILFRAQLNSALETIHRRSDTGSSTGDFTPQKKMIWSTQGLKALGVKLRIKPGTKSRYEMALHHSAETSPKQTVAQLKAIIDDLRHGHLAIVPSVDPNDNTEAEASDDDSNGGEGPLTQDLVEPGTKAERYAAEKKAEKKIEKEIPRGWRRRPEDE